MNQKSVRHVDGQETERQRLDRMAVEAFNTLLDRLEDCSNFRKHYMGNRYKEQEAELALRTSALEVEVAFAHFRLYEHTS